MIPTFNDNVGDMPLDIFGDYVSECLGVEFGWEYLAVTLNSPHICISEYCLLLGDGDPYLFENEFDYDNGYGKGYNYCNRDIAYGTGFFRGQGCFFGCGNGKYHGRPNV